MQRVMRVFCSESAEQDFLSVSPSISIGIVQVKQFIRMGHIGPAFSVGQNASGNDQLIIENGRLVCHSVPVRIIEYDNLIAGLLIDIQLRVDAASRDPESTFVIETDLSGLRDQRCGSEEIDFKSFRDREGRQFGFQIGFRHFLQISLSLDRTNRQ